MMKHHKLLGVLMFSVTLAGGAGGCSLVKNTDTTGPSSRGPSSAATASVSRGADRSQEVLSHYRPPKVLATMKGAWGLTLKSTVTVQVTGVEASPRSTIVRYVVTTAKNPGFMGEGGTWEWPAFPALADSRTKKLYHVNTFTNPDLDGARGIYPLVRSGPVGNDAVTTGQYPPLPSDVKRITIHTPGFKDVSVPVTWKE